jgi:DNA-directed RNA polymerase II subunit RPB2
MSKSSSKKSQSKKSKIDINEDISWKLLDKYFTQDPNYLVRHHLDSYNNFFENGIFNIFKENNPIKFIEREDDTSQDKKVSEINIYLGGKEGKLLYFGKPIIYDSSSDKNKHYMYPNDARLRNMSYSITIHYDIEIEFTYYKTNDAGEKIEEKHNIKKDQIYLGRFPIMVQSNLCILKELSPQVRFNMGECKNDYGGYFIIDGKEKSIVPQEKFANNMIYIKKLKDDKYSYTCDIRSVSEDTSKPIRTLSIKILSPTSKLSNNQIVVEIPNVKKPVPLFILMRALGVISDKEIIQTCILDLNKNNDYVDLFIPCVHDAGKIFTQNDALEFIAVLTKRKTINGVLYILMDLLLPHIGENNFIDKSFFIGYMVYKLLKVFIGVNKPTDRDNYKFKRIELSGDLLNDLFREYYIIQNKSIFQKIDRLYYYDKLQYQEEKIIDLIENNFFDIFKERIVEEGVRKGFKGNWGSQQHTKRIGIVQDLNRLSYYTFISQLRKIVLPLDSTSKVVGPRLLNSSQWGYMDPIDTPDGANIGLHKHLSITTYVTKNIPTFNIISFLRENNNLYKIYELNYHLLSITTKIFVNGIWFGNILETPIEYIENLKLYRRNGIIPIYISISFDYENNEIQIFSDAGRLMRPIYYIYNGKPSYEKIFENEIKEISWTQIITGFHEKPPDFNYKKNIIYKLDDIYPGISDIDSLKETASVIDYIDTSEEECLLIAKESDNISNKYYTNIEILPSLILGVMGNLIIFPSNNPVTRNAFSCGQSKQAVSVFHTNYQMRMDKMSVILNNGQIPLVKSKYLKYINNEEQPYGVNTIVAIMSYTGYNVEDAILINKGSIDRGLFSTTYYTTYEAKEESSTIGISNINSVFSDVITKNVKGLKAGYDYTYIDKTGLVKEGTLINENIVVIGQYNYNNDDLDSLFDSSVFTKKGQLGVVDKSFITEGEEGFRIAKVRIREERTPGIGDKMASRAGQKGTIGLIIPEEDMPYTNDGIRPDIIINPHAIPSRMTIGQLIESLLGKLCLFYGGFGDCTAFETKGTNTNLYGDLLTKAGFHSSGNQVLYNGYTGEQIYSDIYIGPTYYMRLKHMVKDKINYRARGPNIALTRQPVQGRANDGGLRIGEMERDGVMGHGASAFLNDSFMIRGDEYFLAICNKTGTIAIYNKELNLLLSPFADGPIKFSQTINNETNGITMNLQNITRFGRSFSIVRVPYSFKLLLQEVQALNIQMKIITEDNIDQLLNLSFSNNINLLLHNNGEIKQVINDYKHQLENPGYKPSKFIKISLNEMIEKDKLKSIINSYQDAVDIGKRCLNYSKKNISNENPFLNDTTFIRDNYPSSYKNVFTMDLISLENTMHYIFDVLHHSCYFLCVYGGKHTSKLYKLMNTSSSPIIDKEFNKTFKEKLSKNDKQTNLEVKLSPKQIKIIERKLNNPYRTMSCIIKPINDADTFTDVYIPIFNDNINLPKGVYIFNLNDSLILKNDYTFPWNVFPKPTPIDNYGISNKFIPIFSISGQEGYSDIPIPNYDDIKLYNLALDFKTNWDEKEINKAVFRGGPTGCGYTHTTNQRLMLLNMIENTSPEIKEKMLENFDIGIVNNNGEIDKSINNEIVKNDPKYGIGMMNTTFLTKNKINMTMQSNYKYLIHIDGNVNAYRLLTSFLTGSLILRVKSQYTSWFEHLIHPFDIYDSSSSTENTHYIWINEDFTNLLDIMEWCLRNDDKCKEIAHNALEFAREKSRRDYIFLYISMILWSVNDKFSSLYEKKSSSSIKTISSYNPSPHTPEEEPYPSLFAQPFIPRTPSNSPSSPLQEPSIYEQFLQTYALNKSEKNPLVITPSTPSTPPTPVEGFSPPQPLQEPSIYEKFLQTYALNKSEKNPLVITPSTPSPPPTPPEGFSPQTPPQAISPQMTADILSELRSIKQELKEKESVGGSIEETDNQNNILEVEKDKPSEDEQYIKGGSTKKIKIDLK